MKILFITTDFPLPPDQGAKIRNWNIVRELAPHHEIYLVALARTSPSDEALLSAAESCHVVCVENYRGVFRKAWDLIRSLVTGKPYMVLANTHRKMKREVRRLLADHEIDVIHVSELWAADNIPIPSRLPIVLDAHNVEEDVSWQIAQSAPSSVSRAFLSSQASNIAAYERKIASSVAAIITVSEKDRKHFATINKQVVCVPNGVAETHNYSSEGSGRIVFCGSLVYRPNIEGIKWFLENVWPKIKARSSAATLEIIGRNPPRSLTCHADGDVLIAEDVDDVAPHFEKAAAMIVPLHAGGGTRIKILEAFSYGVPVVSTSIGACGLEVESNTHLLIADDDELFAEKTIALLNDSQLRRRLRYNAQKLLNERYLWSKNVPSCTRLYEELVM